MSTSDLIDLGVLLDPGAAAMALLRQIGADLAPIFGWDFHVGHPAFEAPWHSTFYTHIYGCYILCADSGWLFKDHCLLMELQFLHDANWGRSAVIRDPRAAKVVKWHLADFARARGRSIEVSEHYDLPTWSNGGM